VGNWLWRQGAPAANQAVAWWINFGTYALPLDTTGIVTDSTPLLTGFLGIGALGGGNVTILAGGDAGATTKGGTIGNYATSQALDVAVASTGRVVNGVLDQTGGGDITIRIGGALNGGNPSNTVNQLNGTLTDLRGQIGVRASSIGQIVPNYTGIQSTAVDPRPANPLTAALAASAGGPTVVPGDGVVSLSARGDLVLGGAGDPGRLPEQNITPFANLASGNQAAGETWFSLWQPGTAINLLSAGGNLTPSTQPGSAAANGEFPSTANGLATDQRFIYPPTLTAVALSGNVYYGAPNLGGTTASVELAPSPEGQLAIIAGGSIYASDFGQSGTPLTLDISGASMAGLPTPFQPAFRDLADGTVSGVNPAVYNLSAGGGVLPALFALEPDTASGTLHAGDTQPALISAGGDIVGLRLGEIIAFNQGVRVVPTTWYVAGKSVRIEAGGDAVEPGWPAGTNAPQQSSAYSTTGSLILNNSPGNVSTLIAGRDIIYANVDIAGPGLFYVQAGRNLYQADRSVLESLGQITPDVRTRGGGAGITVVAGAGSSGPDWTGFANLYLDPAQQAAHGTPVAVGGDTVVMSYADQLLTYLQQNFGYQGSAADALGFFQALPAEQRSSFLLQIYFDELRDSGREFTNPASPRTKSYVRGREAIAALFPTGRTYQGDITLFGGSGIRSDFGGTVSVLAPGGQVVLGVTSGPQPPASAGVITQGQGDVDIYSLGSVLFGQSRVFTTFGGSIVIWSATGDINAGRGANTTDVFSTPSVLYDNFGNVSLAPAVPTTGAGIAALAPIAGVAKGDVDLIAPLGAIDAGEAGIRVAGNVNLAALTVVNAANIQVGGRSTGLPTIVAPNLGALSSASAAAAAANQAAEQTASNTTGANAAARAGASSVITVEVLGFGNCAAGENQGACASAQ